MRLFPRLAGLSLANAHCSAVCMVNLQIIKSGGGGGGGGGDSLFCFIIYRPKHPLKVHMWAGISLKGRTHMCICEGIMKSSSSTSFKPLCFHLFGISTLLDVG